jgi:hypothetical protein
VSVWLILSAELINTRYKIMNTVHFDRDEAERLEAAYNKAMESGSTIFWFDGKEILTDYARYMLEYLRQEGILGRVH